MPKLLQLGRIFQTSTVWDGLTPCLFIMFILILKIANIFSLDPICQIAVDNSRGLLYCRTEQGSVKVYFLSHLLHDLFQILYYLHHFDRGLQR